MPKYYAIGGVIDIGKPKTGFFGGIEGYYHKASYSFLTHSLYQNFRSRCGDNPRNQKIPQIYLFQAREDATIFSNSRENKAYTERSIALSPVFSIKVDNLNVEFQTSHLVDMPLATLPHTEVSLTEQQVNTLITQNGDHIPDYLYKKEAGKVKKEINWGSISIDSAEFEEFREKCVIEEIYLPGYVKNEDNIYYEERIAREANRSLFDLNWWVVLLLTFWTLVIPIGYTIGRLVNREHASTILHKINDPFDDSLTNEKWLNIDSEYGYYIQKFESTVSAENLKEKDESIVSITPFYNSKNPRINPLEQPTEKISPINK